MIPELAHTIPAVFGIMGPEPASYHRTLLCTRPELIDPGIRALLVAGLLLPAEQYLKALEAWAAITAAIRDAFSHTLDALVSPTLPASAAEHDQKKFVYNEQADPVTVS